MTFVEIGRQVRALHLKFNIPSRLYLIYLWDFNENSHLPPPEYFMEAMWVWLRQANRKGNFSVINSRIFMKIHISHSTHIFYTLHEFGWDRSIIEGNLPLRATYLCGCNSASTGRILLKIHTCHSSFILSK